MAVRYIGKWHGSPNGESPTLWVDEEAGLCYMQGYRVEDPAVQADLLATAGRDHFPAHETLISYPIDMVDLFEEVTRDAEGPESG